MLGKGYDIDVFTFTRLDQLTMGGILAIIEKKNLLSSKYKYYYLSVFLIGAILIAYCSTFDFFKLNLFKHYAFGICYFGLIAISASNSERSLFNRVLSLSFMQYLGKVSYGIYVWHVFALDLVNNLLFTRSILVNFGLVLLITIVISALSYKFLELPFLNLKKYFSYGQTATPQVAIVQKQASD
jgi:peptidoglycan/LPS O-acetylase OafA/YrhL